MRYRAFIVVPAMLVLFGAMIFPGRAVGQSSWLEGDRQKAVSLEMLRPDFMGLDKTSTLTAAWFLSVRWPIGKWTMLVAEMPYANFGNASGEREPESGTSVGNPYLGVETRQRDLPLYLDFGIRLPVLSEEKNPSWTIPADGTAGNREARRVGRFADLSRIEAFLPNCLSVKVMFKCSMEADNPWGFRLGAGPTYRIGVSDDPRLAGDVWLSFGGVAWFQDDQLEMRLSHTARCTIFDEHLPDLKDHMAHQLTLGAGLRLGTIRPGFNIVFPFNDDLGRELEYVIGLRVAYRIG